MPTDASGGDETAGHPTTVRQDRRDARRRAATGVRAHRARLARSDGHHHRGRRGIDRRGRARDGQQEEQRRLVHRGTTGASAHRFPIVKATAFDPPPGDGQENDADVGKTIDGDPNTLWQTSGYNNRRSAASSRESASCSRSTTSTALDKLDRPVADERLVGQDLRERRFASGSRRVG